jgi:4-cresol dehydrogenase (hydroxylating)
MAHVSAAVFDALRRSLGGDAVDTSEETIVRYGRNDLPGGDRRPAGVVYPASTADVQAVIRVANQYRVPVYSKVCCP